jgi:hypothetical protein
MTVRMASTLGGRLSRQTTVRFLTPKGLHTGQR